jgi:hypothetical protein
LNFLRQKFGKVDLFAAGVELFAAGVELFAAGVELFAAEFFRKSLIYKELRA